MDSTLENQPAWTEDDSRNFLDLGRFFVPDREAQIANARSFLSQRGVEVHPTMF